MGDILELLIFGIMLVLVMAFALVVFAYTFVYIGETFGFCGLL